jgi:C1A family cysteine protease
MKRISWLFFSIAMYTSIAAATPTQQYYSKADAGSTITLDADTVASIELWTNPSTGYNWHAQTPLGDNIRILGTSYESSEPGKIGGGGITTIYIVGAAPGTSDAAFSYQRTHAPSSATVATPIDTVSYTFRTNATFSETFNIPEPPIGPPRLEVPSGTSDSLGAVPDAFNWCDENGCTDIKDQGSCGSCWAFSAVATFEGIIRINDGYESDLSEQYLLQCNDDNWNCQGGMWAHDYHEWKTVSGQSEAGAVLESDLPYVGQDRSCGSDHSKAYKIDDWAYVDGSQGSLPSTDDIKQAIYDHGPISVAVCSQGMSDYTGGIYTNSCSSLDHAVNLVGWNDADGGYWIMRNSWGSSWGEDGYMRIGYGISGIGNDANYVVYGDSPSPDPDPTPTPTPDPDLTILENGVAVTGLSGDRGASSMYALDVSAGATGLSFTMSGGSGDADLYVRFGSTPTNSSYDCRPYLTGSDEVCEFKTAEEGRYYLMINGYTAYSDVSL